MASVDLPVRPRESTISGTAQVATALPRKVVSKAVLTMSDA